MNKRNIAVAAGVVSCLLVVYGLISFMGHRERDQQIAGQLQAQSEPADIAVPGGGGTPAGQEGSSAGGSSAPEGEQRKADKAVTAGFMGQMITLRNGRTIIADSCSEFGTLMTCETQEGRVQIERADVESMKEIRVLRRASVEGGQTVVAPAEGQAGVRVAALGQPGAAGEGGQLKILSPEDAGRIDRINEKKTELLPERQRLIRERGQLHEDVKNQGLIRSQGQYDVTIKRIADLDVEIGRFNDEVKKLNDEARAILDAPPPAAVK